MSRWDRWGWYEPAPKKPPPEHGIKMKKSGSTWWGQRWVQALERMSLGYSNRLARGRTYARAGRTHDLTVKAGEVNAKVTGTRATPYRVRITLRKLSDRAWGGAITAMSRQAQFAAELLAGRMPEEIDTAFKEAGASLFPVKESDLRTDCTCPDWANPCKHVAATHYVLGEAFDRDPFLLFELRGRTKEQVLKALCAARAGARPQTRKAGKRSGGKASVAKASPSDEVPAVTLGRLSAANYDKPRAALPALHLTFEVPPASGALLRQLGAPPGWSLDASPAEVLGPMVQAAAERARALAMADPEVGVDPEVDRGMPKKTAGKKAKSKRPPRRRL